MFSLYILVSSFFADIAPANLMALESLVKQPQTTISVSFDEVNSLKIGSPVISNGIIVGEVSKISNDSKTNAPVTVEMNVRGNIANNTVALESKPTLASKSKPEAIVELLSLPISSVSNKKQSQQIKGFSSFEKFWSAGI